MEDIEIRYIDTKETSNFKDVNSIVRNPKKS
jgi:hypothetical protein